MKHPAKIIQIAVSSETEGDYPKLIVLTNTGEIIACVLSPDVLSGKEGNWSELLLPSELTPFNS